MGFLDKKDSKKDLIADAALSCFLLTGYGGTSMDDIVKASGMSKGGIYWHFKGKEEIFLYLAEKWMSETERELLALSAGNGPTMEKLIKLEEHYLDKINGPVSAIIYEFTLQAKDKEILKRLHTRINNSKRNEIIKNIIQTAINKGEFRPLDADTATDVFISLFEGISLQWFTRHKDKKTLESTANMALDIFFEGVLNKQ
ncbi:MAG: TetR/AcrR family transcriptional regulator [Desulfitobacteriaceae bacterium]|nr:TetR/AcrR family transcriptional regulator [Desulfitobacteriaceae bacterium]